MNAAAKAAGEAAVAKSTGEDTTTSATSSATPTESSAPAKSTGPSTSTFDPNAKAGPKVGSLGKAKPGEMRPSKAGSTGSGGSKGKSAMAKVLAKQTSKVFTQNVMATAFTKDQSDARHDPAKSSSRRAGTLESIKKRQINASGAGSKMVGNTPLDKLSSLQAGITDSRALPTADTIGIKTELVEEIIVLTIKSDGPQGFKLSPDNNGVVIDVTDGQMASKAGLVPYDVILRLASSNAPDEWKTFYETADLANFLKFSNPAKSDYFMEVMRFEKMKNAKSLTNGTYKRSVLEKNAVQFERFVKDVEKCAN